MAYGPGVVVRGVRGTDSARSIESGVRCFCHGLTWWHAFESARGNAKEEESGTTQTGRLSAQDESADITETDLATTAASSMLRHIA